MMLLRYLGCWPKEDEEPTSRADSGSQDKARARQHRCSATAITPTPTQTQTPPVRATARSANPPNVANVANDLAALAAAEQEVDEADEEEKKRQQRQHQHDHHHPQSAAALLLLSPDLRHHYRASAADNNSNSRSSTGGAYTAIALSCAAIAASSSGGSGGVDQLLHQPQPSLPPPPPLPQPPPSQPPPLRVAAAEPLPAEALTNPSGLPWSQLRAAYSVGDLDFYGAGSNGGGGSSGGGGSAAAAAPHTAKTRSSSNKTNKKKTAVDVNSGGAVFVLVFASEEGHNKRERLAVLKLPACSGPLAGRLAAQAEALAAELATAASVPTPAARLLRRPSREWDAAMEAADGLLVSSWGRGRRSRLLSAGRLFAGSSSGGGTSSSSGGGSVSIINPIPPTPTTTPSLSTELRHPSCPPVALLLEFCPGAPLNRAAAAAIATAPSSAAIARDAGAVLALDLLLDNPDRFPMPRLGWRGNPGNVLVAGARLVAIDACVPRQRPGAAARRLAATDAEAERVAQLACADAGFARQVMRMTLLGTQALPHKGEEDEAAFQNGLRSTLLGIESAVGLLETAERALRTSLRGFAEDALAALGGPVVPSPSRPAGAAAPSSSSSSSSSSSPLAQLRSQLAAGLRVEPCAAASPLAHDLPTPACILTDLPLPSSSLPHQQQRPPPPPPPPPPQPQPLTAAALAAIVAEARGGRSSPELAAVVTAWQERLRRELEGLAGAARDWAARRRRKREEEEGTEEGALPPPPPPPPTWLLASYLQPYNESTTTTSTTSALADAHDLCSRLAHLLRRAKLLASAASARQPDLVPLPPLPTATTTTTTHRPPPRLYIGDAVSADCAHVLQRLGVRRVLCCARELPWPPLAGGGLVAAARLALVDGGGWGHRGGQAAAATAPPSYSSLIEHQLDAAVEWIGEALEQAACEEVGDEQVEEEGDGRGVTSTTTPGPSSSAVLVHCSEGKSRSAAVVAAFLMARAGLSAAEALAVVHAARPCASPHPLFVAALEGYEEERRRREEEAKAAVAADAGATVVALATASPRKE